MLRDYENKKIGNIDTKKESPMLEAHHFDDITITPDPDQERLREKYRRKDI